MDQNSLMNALVQVKRIGNLLNEVQDVSQQIEEAVNRNDQVSIQLLVHMREEPIQKLQVADKALREQIASFTDPKDASRLADLLNGKPPKEANEQMLADLVAANARRFKQVIALDSALGRKVAREKSVYQSNIGLG